MGTVADPGGAGGVGGGGGKTWVYLFWNHWK